MIKIEGAGNHIYVRYKSYRVKMLVIFNVNTILGNLFGLMVNVRVNGAFYE